MKTILLVEDDPFLIDIYATKLKKSGFKTEVVTDGESALKKIRQKMPDILLLDIVLPQTDGWKVLREIKEDPNLQNLKVVILSNLGQKEEVEKGLKLGAIKYLIKSFYTPSQVVEEIKKILDQNEQ